MKPQDIHMHGFIEVGAAGLLIGGMETRVKDHAWKDYVNHNFTDADMPHPSTATMAINFISSNSHLKAVTAFKRMKAGPNQVWHVFFLLLFLSIFFIFSIFFYHVFRFASLSFLYIPFQQLYCSMYLEICCHS